MAQRVNRLPGSAGDLLSIPRLGRSPGEGNGNPFQYSCKGNPKDRGDWQATVHGVAKSWMRLSNFTSIAYMGKKSEKRVDIYI